MAGLALRDGLDEHLARAADVYLSEARLRHDGDVGLDAVLYERARADGIGLFIGEEGHREHAGESVGPLAAHVLGERKHQRYSGFHVARAEAVEPLLAADRFEDRGVRVRVPAADHRHRVDVPGEEQRLAQSAAAHLGVDDEASVVGRNFLGAEARGFHSPITILRDLVFVARGRRD